MKRISTNNILLETLGDGIPITGTFCTSTKDIRIENKDPAPTTLCNNHASLKTELAAFKLFVLEQFFLIKQLIQNFKDPNHEATSSTYIAMFMEQIEYLKEESKVKNSIIRSLTSQYNNILIVLQLITVIMITIIMVILIIIMIIIIYIKVVIIFLTPLTTVILIITLITTIITLLVLKAFLIIIIKKIITIYIEAIIIFLTPLTTIILIILLLIITKTFLVLKTFLLIIKIMILLTLIIMVIIITLTLMIITITFPIINVLYLKVIILIISIQIKLAILLMMLMLLLDVKNPIRKHNININNNNNNNNNNENENNSSNENSTNNKDNVTSPFAILGDSNVKKLNGFLLRRKLNHKYLVKVRPFSSEKFRCMHDHVKPIVPDFNPDHIILHCKTNDLSSERTASQIARSIIRLALSLKS